MVMSCLDVSAVWIKWYNKNDATMADIKARKVYPMLTAIANEPIAKVIGPYDNS